VDFGEGAIGWEAEKRQELASVQRGGGTKNVVEHSKSTVHERLSAKRKNGEAREKEKKKMRGKGKKRIRGERGGSMNLDKVLMRGGKRYGQGSFPLVALRAAYVEERKALPPQIAPILLCRKREMLNKENNDLHRKKQKKLPLSMGAGKGRAGGEAPRSSGKVNIEENTTYEKSQKKGSQEYEMEMTHTNH